MTVAELIAKLQKLPQDAVVIQTEECQQWSPGSDTEFAVTEFVGPYYDYNTKKLVSNPDGSPVQGKFAML